MKVAILRTKDMPRSNYMFAAFADGVRTHGDEPIDVGLGQLDRLDAADVAAQICYPNRHHKNEPIALFRLKANELLQAAGKRVLTIDTGFFANQYLAKLRPPVGVPPFLLDRVNTFGAYDRRIYYSVGYDGLKRGADYCTGEVTPERWNALGASLQPWRRRGKTIVLAGQPLHGLSSQETDIYAWYRDVFAAVRKLRLPYSLVYRQHPRTFGKDGRGAGAKRDLDKVRLAARGVRFAVSQKRELTQDLANAWAAIAFTSNVAVESVAAGTPVIAGSPLCAAWDVSGHELAALQRPPTPDRQPWASRLAYAQWNCAEFRSGECWAHFRPHARTRREAAA